MHCSTSKISLDVRHRLTDEQILDRVRAGENGLYEILIQRYHRRLYCIALRILRNDAEAEDAVQEAHLLALRRLDQFAGRSSFFTWMARITMNEAFMRIRGRTRLERLEAAASAPGTFGFMSAPGRSPEQQALDGELDRALEVGVRALPEPYRVVFRLREMDEHTTAEAAVVLGITEECVKTRLHRARELLRKRLRRTAGRQYPAAYVQQPGLCAVN